MKKVAILFCICMMFGACSSTNILNDVGKVLDDMTGQSGALSNKQIGDGLKEALVQGITKGAGQVSKTDGYFKNPKIKIPWPADVKKVENTLRDIGLGGEVDKVVLNLNRAAEDAAKKAKPIFIGAIKQLTFQDVMGILKGNDNAATNFLRRTTSTQLGKEFSPVIQTSLDKMDATKHWGSAINKYNKVPFVKKVNPDLNGYVTEKAMDGLFTMIEKEEKKIRKDPVARTTDLLKKVFKLQDS